jgi:hypothetical protein
MDAESHDFLDRAIWRTRLIETLTAPALPVWCSQADETADALPVVLPVPSAPLALSRRRWRNLFGR